MIAAGRHQTDHQKQAAAAALSKTYKVTTPAGVEIVVTNLNAFCKEHNHDQANMVSVAKGRGKSHKRYRCALIE